MSLSMAETGMRMTVVSAVPASPRMESTAWMMLLVLRAATAATSVAPHLAPITWRNADPSSDPAHDRPQNLTAKRLPIH